MEISIRRKGSQGDTATSLRQCDLLYQSSDLSLLSLLLDRFDLSLPYTYSGEDLIYIENEEENWGENKKGSEKEEDEKKGSEDENLLRSTADSAISPPHIFPFLRSLSRLLLLSSSPLSLFFLGERSEGREGSRGRLLRYFTSLPPSPLFPSPPLLSLSSSLLSCLTNQLDHSSPTSIVREQKFYFDTTGALLSSSFHHWIIYGPIESPRGDLLSFPIFLLLLQDIKGDSISPPPPLSLPQFIKGMERVGFSQSEVADIISLLSSLLLLFLREEEKAEEKMGVAAGEISNYLRTPLTNSPAEFHRKLLENVLTYHLFSSLLSLISLRINQSLSPPHFSPSNLVFSFFDFPSPPDLADRPSHWSNYFYSEYSSRLADRIRSKIGQSPSSPILFFPDIENSPFGEYLNIEKKEKEEGKKKGMGEGKVGGISAGKSERLKRKRSQSNNRDDRRSPPPSSSPSPSDPSPLLLSPLSRERGKKEEKSKSKGENKTTVEATQKSDNENRKGWEEMKWEGEGEIIAAMTSLLSSSSLPFVHSHLLPFLEKSSKNHPIVSLSREISQLFRSPYLPCLYSLSPYKFIKNNHFNIENIIRNLNNNNNNNLNNNNENKKLSKEERRERISDQLSKFGIFETIKTIQSTFSDILPIFEFTQKYAILGKQDTIEISRRGCKKILHSLLITSDLSDLFFFGTISVCLHFDLTCELEYLLERELKLVDLTPGKKSTKKSSSFKRSSFYAEKKISDPDPSSIGDQKNKDELKKDKKKKSLFSRHPTPSSPRPASPRSKRLAEKSTNANQSADTPDQSKPSSPKLPLNSITNTNNNNNLTTNNNTNNNNINNNNNNNNNNINLNINLSNNNINNNNNNEMSGLASPRRGRSISIKNLVKTTSGFLKTKEGSDDVIITTSPRPIIHRVHSPPFDFPPLSPSKNLPLEDANSNIGNLRLSAKLSNFERTSSSDSYFAPPVLGLDESGDHHHKPLRSPLSSTPIDRIGDDDRIGPSNVIADQIISDDAFSDPFLFPPISNTKNGNENSRKMRGDGKGAANQMLDADRLFELSSDELSELSELSEGDDVITADDRKMAVIDHIENLSWRSSSSSLPLSPSSSLPSPPSPSPLLSHPYILLNLSSSSPPFLLPSFPPSPLPSPPPVDLLSKIDEFLLLYESGSFIRSYFQKEHENYDLSSHFSPRNFVVNFPANSPSSPLAQSHSSTTSAVAMVVSNSGISSNSATSSTIRSFLSPNSAGDFPLSSSPSARSPHLLSDEGRGEEENDEDENGKDDDDDDKDQKEIDENDLPIADLEKKNTLKNRLSLCALSQINIDSIVNELHFTNPIRSSPRKHKPALSFFEVSASYNFADYARTHFNLPKKMAKLKPTSSKYKNKLKKLISFSKVGLEGALHELRGAAAEVAVANFKHIIAYLFSPFDISSFSPSPSSPSPSPLSSSSLQGGRDNIASANYSEKSSAPINQKDVDKNPPINPLRHAEIIIQNGLERNSIRDEIYCQLIKQINNNHNKKLLNKAWELMAFCVGCFSPSPIFIKYLIRYFDDIIHNQINILNYNIIDHTLNNNNNNNNLNNNNNNINNNNNLNNNNNNNINNNIKNDGEVIAWANYCKDRLDKTLRYNKRLFVPTELELIKVKEKKPILQTFHFLDGRQKQVPIYSSTTTLDALEFLTVMIGLKDVKGYMIYEQYTVTNKENIDVDMTERSLLYSEVLCNSLSKFEEFKNYYKDLSLNAECKFIVKRKLFLDDRSSPPSDHPVENHLLFFQICNDIKTGTMMIEEVDALILGGLFLQIKYGDYVKGRAIQPGNIYPSRLIAKKNIKFWKNELAKKHAMLLATSPDECRHLVLHYCRQLPFFGYHTFYVTFTSPYGNNSSWKLAESLYIAISVNGILLLTEEKNVLYRFTYLEIIRQRSTPSSLILSFDSLDDLLLNTDKGDEILSLIIDYKYYEFKKLSELYNNNS